MAKNTRMLNTKEEDSRDSNFDRDNPKIKEKEGCGFNQFEHAKKRSSTERKVNGKKIITTRAKSREERK